MEIIWFLDFGFLKGFYVITVLYVRYVRYGHLYLRDWGFSRDLGLYCEYFGLFQICIFDIFNGFERIFLNLQIKGMTIKYFYK